MPRAIGTKNKRTVYREKLAALKLNGNEFIGESLAVMGEAMQYLVGMARTVPDGEPEKRTYYLAASEVADRLAPFRYARLAALHMTGTINHDWSKMEPDELLREIQSEAAAIGMKLLPSPKKRGGVQIEAEAEEED